MLLIYSAHRRDYALSAFDRVARNDRVVNEGWARRSPAELSRVRRPAFGRSSFASNRSVSVARLAARIAVGSQDGSYVGKSEENQIWGWQSPPDPCRAGFCESRFAIRR